MYYKFFLREKKHKNELTCLGQQSLAVRPLLQKHIPLNSFVAITTHQFILQQI